MTLIPLSKAMLKGVQILLTLPPASAPQWESSITEMALSSPSWPSLSKWHRQQRGLPCSPGQGLQKWPIGMLQWTEGALLTFSGNCDFRLMKAKYNILYFICAMTIQSCFPPTSLLYNYCPWVVIYNTPLHSQKSSILESKLYCQSTYVGYQEQIPLWSIRGRICIEGQTGFLSQGPWSRRSGR